MNKKIKFDKANLKNSYDKPSSRVCYTSSYFGVEMPSGRGRGVKICVIDSGMPEHNDIRSLRDLSVDFTDSPNGVRDVHGHATAVSGILCGSGEIVGLVPDATIFYAKALSDNGEGDSGAIIASILWAIVQDVDLIVMAFGAEAVHPTLHDAVRKAYDSNIAMVASAGNHNIQTKDAYFPARFNEVISVSYSNETEGSSLVKSQDASMYMLPNKPLETTFLNQKYIRFGGSSAIVPVVGGLYALFAERLKSTKGVLPVAEAYGQFANLIK